MSSLKDTKAKDETSSDSEDKMAAINKNLSFGKRKSELMMDGGEVVEKRKKGRPRKDKMAATVPQPFTQVERKRWIVMLLSQFYWFKVVESKEAEQR